MLDPAALVHPKAHVEGAAIGARSRVWQFASVVRGSRLGLDCSVGAGAQIDGAWLGDRCLVGANAILVPGVWAGDDVFIGPGVITCNDAWPGVGKSGFDLGALLFGFVTVRIETGAAIGAGAIILPGVVIGRGAIIAAGSVVNANVPPRYLWKRSGRMAEIDLDYVGPRMRPASAPPGLRCGPADEAA
jgi:UDP-2-acetamido-3-amino-2,3-dideoxy-glucuronate N-acetyltransferase